MLKALIKLVLLALVPLFYLLIAENYNPIRFLSERFIEHYMNAIYIGVFEETERRLQGLDSHTQKQEFDKIASHFGVIFKLVPLSELSISQAKKNRLVSGELVAIESDGEVVAYKVKHSNWVITAAAEQTEDQDTYRLAKGPMYLLRSALGEIPAENLHLHIPLLEERFSWQFQLVDPKGLSEFTEGKRHVSFDDVQWVVDGDEEVFLVDVAGEQTILVKPTWESRAEPLALVTLFIVFFLCVALGLTLWLWPLWRDHKRINQSALAFGRGHLESRAPVRKGAFSAELADSFNQMADNIQNLINANQQLTNAVAHDLRTPLSRLRFANEILASRECSAKEREEYMGVIASSVDTLDYLISQNLLHSRYNRSTDIKQFVWCDFAAEILDEVDQYRFEYETLDFDTNIDAALTDGTQFVDAKALRRALSNLLSNAVKYAVSYVRVSYFQKDGRIGFKVEDDGAGIDEQDYDKVFQPYIQLNNSERNNAQGVGLGLAIVKQITRWHKGEVAVGRSALGGAAFTLSWSADLSNTRAA